MRPNRTVSGHETEWLKNGKIELNFGTKAWLIAKEMSFLSKCEQCQCLTYMVVLFKWSNLYSFHILFVAILNFEKAIFIPLL